MVYKQFCCLIFFLTIISAIHAQDTATNGYKYVVLHYDHNNNAVPDFQKFRDDLEDGIKDLLTKSKIPMLRYQKEAAEKKLHDCDTLTCTYTIEYAQGMMLNAKIKCALKFTDCHKKEVLQVSAGKMTGAVAGADSYLKVFEKLIKPGMLGKFKQ